jgi:energy-coupling factor transport system ATP-binding protein
MLETLGVCYHPATVPQPILQGITLSVKQGELCAIFGTSGSGKSTLLEILSGLVLPTKGHILCGGKRLLPIQLQQKIGLVFQFPERHFCGRTLEEELNFGHDHNPWALREVLRQMGLADLDLTVNPRNLSGGQQRRVAIAVQLLRQPDFLLLDEPLAGLDWSVRAQMVAVISQLRKYQGVIIVTHDRVEFEAKADQILHLEQGKLA